MTLLRTIALPAILGLVLTASARAQTGIAVVNPVKVFNEMQETNDLKQKVNAEGQAFRNEAKAREQKVNDLKAQRDLLKSDSPSYAELNKQLVQAAVDARAWSEITNAQAQLSQKLQMKGLFEKIAAQVAEIAQSKGLELVIAMGQQNFPENLDQITVDQLGGMFGQRTVMYANPKLDITQEVIAALDAKYRAGGGATSTPAAPAPAPAPVIPAPAPAPAPAPNP
jgi:Skp family chaperone for outer membrane proteins